MAAAASATFAELPYLNKQPLETRFPYLTPDNPRQRSQSSSLACTRIAILGSLKANRLQGIYHSSIEPYKASSRGAIDTSRNNAPEGSHAERSILDLLTNPITEPILLAILGTRDLIALRQTSRFLRTNLDRQPRLWRTINLSYPRSLTQPWIRMLAGGKPFEEPLHFMYRILRNHVPNSPISPFHHIRVLILDNYKFRTTHYHIVEDLLFAIFSNQCLWTNLKMLSIRGFWNLTIDHVSGYLRDWEVGIRGDFRKKYGWRYIETESGFRVVDRSGNVIPTQEWYKKRGWSLEVLRIASPNLFERYNRSVDGKTAIPARVPSNLSLPINEILENGEPLAHANYLEFYIPESQKETRTGHMAEALRALRLAEKIGVTIDIGICKNESGHANIRNVIQGLTTEKIWGFCERKWEMCTIPRCKWEGWTEACSYCRWNEGWCCKGCYGWVCEGCRGKKKGDFGAKGVWCGGAAEKCSVVKEKIIDSDSV